MSDAMLAERAEADRPLLALFRRYGRGNRRYFVAASVAGALSTFLSFADVYLIGLGIDALFNGEPFAVPGLPAAWVPTEPIPLLLFVTGLLVALNVLTNLGGFVDEYASGLFTQRFLHELRVSVFDDVQRREPAFFDRARTGDVIGALNDDVNRLDSFFSTIAGAGIWIAVTLGSAVAYMGALNAQLALVVLLAAPLVAGFNVWFSRRLEPLQDAVRERRGTLNARLETTLSGTDVVTSFGAEAFERDRAADASRDLFRSRYESRRAALRQEPVNRLVVGGWLLLTLALGTYWVVEGPPPGFSGTLTAGELVPFLFYLERLTLPLRNLTGVVDGYTSAKASAKRIDGLTAGVDPERSSDEESGSSRRPAVDGGRVAFEGATFAYPGSDRPALDGVDLVVELGETVGVVGATGAGKSTLVDLLLRLREADTGRVTVDGRDVRDLPVRRLRAAVGYVDQESFLFDGSVRYNVAYGASGTAPGDVPADRVEAAARLAGAHEFVRDLPDGYDTRVGERGVKLSGGQRQRLAVARAVVDEPPVLVLDEATSHVDSETERLLQENLADLAADRTTLVVAHRLSTVREADRIVVLDDGAVAECGSHGALLDRGGRYATLWELAVGGEAETGTEGGAVDSHPAGESDGT
ncbi:ABC transporter ATP-binding protein [Halobium salinum]|uniref:ABC transporter ATP-binding protein n=1 Tax=Halobium salinum TaxID=1364940 RepID=A0ABD5PER4_9EURY|nr:ABC transporter ATP-binding protein [Halobium salinum]